MVMKSTRSEDLMGEKVDRCIADSILKICGGLAIGIVSSVALFKGRLFPVWFGSGVGLGMGWSNCRHDFQSPFLLHGRKILTDHINSSNNSKAEYTILIEPATFHPS
ncbi:unnamed protein product [Dracunculus medinensis]|uniref:MICOS complex subunit MIC10 n=1 Tax=Dracunculus medinensis TaxID=318479 RepID=A0A0N4UGZ8_DRAME|nr:unnamed protein product [Dracunculus medinensis]